LNPGSLGSLFPTLGNIGTGRRIMPIKDNGFTFIKGTAPLGDVAVVGKAIHIDASCLADLKDWFESALNEVNAKIEEIG
jgi:hypothetical protein